jgi:hypothetical protein
MTANEMAYEFRVLYDKIASAGAPGYTDREVGVFLSRACRVLFDESFDAYKSFEETEQRRKFFSNLKEADTPAVSTSQIGVQPNGVFYDLPANFGYAAKEEVTTASTDPCKNNKRIKVKPITEDEYNQNKLNPYKRPYCLDNDGLVWRMDFNTERHELITDGSFTITNYHLRYWRLPNEIIPFTGDGSTTAQQDSDTNEALHIYIVEKAVRMATGVTVPQEYQIKVNEEKLNQ